MNILAVDDEDNARALLVKEIQKVCPEDVVDAFALPLDAIAAADQTDYQVAFLDVEMPQMNGVQLAKRLKIAHPEINIIFVTAYREYSLDAMELHASGYLLKPVSKQAIKQELDNLRYPVETKQTGIRALTFGTFDFLCNGKSVRFGRSKSKELLAYLVDRHGQGVSKKEIAAVLFEDEPYSHKVQNYVSKIVQDLSQSLRAVGAEKVFVKRYNYFAVDTEQFSCDLYEYEKGMPDAINRFRGEYMSQYSWAENAYSYFM